jgi:hypothetical protein
MMKQILQIFRTQRPTPLGRWSVKTCDELKTAFNSVYQNRDHCGDTICKTPKKADEYTEIDKRKKKY